MDTFETAERSGPRVLVAFGSRHGSTEEIALEIGRQLAEDGCVPTVRSADLVTSASGYDAFVIGSGVYMGRWLSAAREMLARHRDVLRTKPVWLFSSGPLGYPPRPENDGTDAANAALELGAIESRRFGGRLDRSMLSFTERATVRLVGAEEGDFRDWEVIRGWAAGIATMLHGREPVVLRYGT